MSEYGVFASLVAIAGCLTAAAGAIGLAWMRRARWQPPEEALPAVVSHFSGLITAIFIAVLYVFGESIGLERLAYISGTSLLVSILALATTVYTNVRYSFFYPDEREENRKLGGSVLTDEAREIAKKFKQTEQEMFSDGRGAKDRVWTRPSQARVQLRSTLSFIGLIAFGTSGLAAASMLVAIYLKSPAPV